MPVFKYLAPERIDVLENLKIRFTQASALNDPFESLPMIEKLIDPNIFFDMFEEHVTKEDFRETIEKTLAEELAPYKSLINVETFQNSQFVEHILKNFRDITEPFLNILNDPKNSSENFSTIIKKSFDNKFGVLSLTQKPDNLLMWSHYSNSHTGFVIEFDQNSSFFNQCINENDTIRKLKFVEYVSERPNITVLDNKAQDEEKYLYTLANLFFLVKSSHWVYEEELRMVMPLETANKVLTSEYGEEIYLFKFPPQMIKSIIFGSQAKKSTVNKINNLLELEYFSHVLKYQAELDLKKYKINLIKL